MRRTAIATVIGLAFALSAGALAHAEQQRTGLNIPDFAALDANKDGKVTKEEFLAALPADQRSVGERVFAARDANKDGVITSEEMAPRS
jgi:hypothetical protein